MNGISMKADPVSIKKDLLAAAEVAAKMEHRTPAEQLEYWAYRAQGCPLCWPWGVVESGCRPSRD